VIAAIGATVFIAALAGAIYALTRSSRLMRASFVTPLFNASAHTAVSFDAPGVYTVYHETPHVARLFKRFRYLLWDPATQTWIASRWAPSRKYLGGETAQRWRVRYLDVPHAGDYQFAVEGLEPGDEMKIVIGRYAGAADMWQTVGILGLMAALGAVIVTVIAIQ
jgi:hypothetical protein